MATLFRIVMARIGGFFRARSLDREFVEELETHLTLAEEEKIRQGMSPQQARREARLELGGVTQLREANHQARGLPWVDSFWLDIKLGLRMLRKSWGLTLVGGLAMTLAIAIGVVVFLFFGWAFGGTLPLAEGDQIVAIQTWEAKSQRRFDTAGQDLERWAGDLRSLAEVGAFETIERNLLLGDGSVEPVSIAEMTASGFQLARVSPLLGRTLVAEDELPGAAPVVVVGHEVWRTRFAGDPSVVGRTLRLGESPHTVVGVMPEGFAFPVNHHFWIPRPDERSRPLRAGPEGAVFARLAPSATLAGAQAEVAALGILPSALPPDPDRVLEARVVPYTFAFSGDSEPSEVRWLIRVALVLTALLLVPPCANIAILVYARTITRREEFAARYSLGASRGRIVAQLFVEMLVLSLAAALAALGVVHLALGWAVGKVINGSGAEPAFWLDFGLSPRSILFALGLGVIAAVLAGLVPALKATGRQMQVGLQGLGNRTGIRLGATWTALVVAQVALCLAALPTVFELTWGTVRTGVLGPGFAAEQYLTARVTMDQDLEPRVATAGGEVLPPKLATLQTELVRRLRDEPGVQGATLAALPGDEPWKQVEVEGSTLPETGILSGPGLVRVNRVDDAFFEVFDYPFLSGSGFESGDFDQERSAVVINRTFASQLLGEVNPLGQRIRLRPSRSAESSSEPPTWYEIVGVVADRPANVDRGTMYLPASSSATAVQLPETRVALQIGSDRAVVIDRLRQVTRELNPNLRLDEIKGLDEIYRSHRIGNDAGAFSLAAVTLSVLLLSAAGMYALMSFTVNQRRREIGIRAALGAQPRRLLASIYRRAGAQLLAGAVGGVVIALLLDHYLPAEVFGGWGIPGIIPAATLFMMLVGLLATAGPARRGLRVEPIEELRQG